MPRNGVPSNYWRGRRHLEIFGSQSSLKMFHRIAIDTAQVSDVKVGHFLF